MWHFALAEVKSMEWAEVVGRLCIQLCEKSKVLVSLTYINLKYQKLQWDTA